MVCSTVLRAQKSTLLGDWREPTGSVLRIGYCGTEVCMKIISVSAHAPATVDIHNLNPGQRNRALCNLEIGSHFSLTDPTHASGGALYDPKSGRTYHGTMSVEGNDLKLRGYIGAPIFGKTETWHRVSEKIAVCASNGGR
nr:DUF2147 domain-containing protein [Terriglobus saanensis]